MSEKAVLNDAENVIVKKNKILEIGSKIKKVLKLTSTSILKKVPFVYIFCLTKGNVKSSD